MRDIEPREIESLLTAPPAAPRQSVWTDARDSNTPPAGHVPTAPGAALRPAVRIARCARHDAQHRSSWLEAVLLLLDKRKPAGSAKEVRKEPRRWAGGLAAVLLLALAAACGMPAPDTPLTIAVEQEDLVAVQRLLAAGADPDGFDGFGLTPLVRASRRGNVAMVEALLAAGASPSRFDRPPSRPGWTPLMNAAHKGQPAVIRALLAAGADANARASDGAVALTLAVCEPEPESVSALLAAGGDPRPGRGGSEALTTAVAFGLTENVTALLDHDPSLRVERSLRGRAALVLARIRGKKEILSRLGAASRSGLMAGRG